MIKISVEEIGGQQLSNLEWLVTNGIGGFASGTVSGVLTRRYHGYLVAALKPPVKRINMVAKVDDWVLNHGELYSLSDNVWKSNSELIQPRGGLKSLNHFSLDGTIPTWIYACGNSEIKKQIWMEHGKNTTYIHYTYLSGREGIRLTLKGLLAYCDFHHTNQVSKPYTILPVEQGVKVRAFNNASDYFLFSHSSKATPREIWIKNYYLSEEDYRGQDSLAAYFNGVDFMGELLPGQSLTLVITVDPKAETDGTSALNKQRARDTKFEGAKFVSDSPEWVRQLVLAADQFIVERSIDNQPGNSIIAGYHWFSDWGRDTMIALPGLTLSTGRFNVAEKILRTFALYVDQGMLPNRFPDLGENPVYNTIDATLWYIEAIYQFYKTVTPQDPKKALSLVSDLFPILENIVKFHETGTRYNVKVDPEDGLLYGGEPGVQLTWMDAKVEDFVVTPREGKPVEINALWYSALSIMSEFAGILGREKNEYQEKAERVRSSFDIFWNEEKGCCYDVVGGPNGNDQSLRPNQVLAVSVSFSPLSVEKQKIVLGICEQHFLTPNGLRSLSNAHHDYVGEYGGDIWKRDTAYHQGTVWGWLLGPYLSAHLRVFNDRKYIRKRLEQYVEQLKIHGLGSISEIFDGDFPYTPRGCIAQAWSVAAALQVWGDLNQTDQPGSNPSRN